MAELNYCAMVEYLNANGQISGTTLPGKDLETAKINLDSLYRFYAKLGRQIITACTEVTCARCNDAGVVRVPARRTGLLRTVKCPECKGKHETEYPVIWVDVPHQFKAWGPSAVKD